MLYYRLVVKPRTDEGSNYFRVEALGELFLLRFPLLLFITQIQRIQINVGIWQFIIQPIILTVSLLLITKYNLIIYYDPLQCLN